MKILLDTQAFLWSAVDSHQLSNKAKKTFLNEKNHLFISLATVWEIAIKVSIGKLKFKKSYEKIILEQIQENSITLLNLNFRHVAKVSALPFHHRDPFDRLLAAQALEEKLNIISSDSIFDDYQIHRIW